MKRSIGTSARLCATLAATAATVALGAPPALGASAPAALTGPVSALGSTTATLGGSVNPNGTATTYVFQYGPSATDYTQQTTSQSAGSGTSDTPVSASLTALSPGTTYHYRLVATSSAGTTNRAATGSSRPRLRPPAVTAAASNHRHELGDAQRHRRSERPGDELLLRVRDERELRLGHEHELGRLGHRLGGRFGRPQRASGRADLSLPRRRGERRRHDRRQRHELHAQQQADRDDLGRDVGELDRRPPQRQRQPQRSRRRPGTSSTGPARRATARRRRRRRWPPAAARSPSPPA